MTEAAVERGAAELERRTWPMVDQDTEPIPWPILAAEAVLQASGANELAAALDAIQGEIPRHAWNQTQREERINNIAVKLSASGVRDDQPNQDTHFLDVLGRVLDSMDRCLSLPDVEQAMTNQEPLSVRIERVKKLRADPMGDWVRDAGLLFPELVEAFEEAKAAIQGLYAFTPDAFSYAPADAWLNRYWGTE